MSTPRPTVAQDILWRLEAAAYVVVFALLRLMDIETASALGGWLALRLGPLTGSHRVVQRNLRLAFPDMPEAEREALARAQWDNLGRSTFELPFMEELQPHRGRVQVVGAERLEEIRRLKKEVRS